MMRIEELERERREHVKRANLMREHLREIEMEMEATRERARGARTAWESESHLILLDRANRERAKSVVTRCKAIMATQHERRDEYTRRAEAYERALSRLQARAGNADALCDLVRERLLEDEREFVALRTYEVEDTSLLKKLEFELCKVSRAVYESKLDIEDAMSLRLASQCELQRVRKSLKDAHARHVDLNETLARANVTLSERKRLSEKMLNTKEQLSRELDEKQANVRELNQTAKRIELLNKGSQSKVTSRQKVLRHKTEKCQELKSDLVSSTQALVTATHMQAASVRAAESAKARRCDMEEKLRAHVEARDEKQRQVKKARQALEDELASLMTSEECLERLQRAHDEEASTLEGVLSALEADKASLFNVSKTLRDQKQSQCRVEIEFNGAMLQNKNLHEKEQVLQMNIMKQKEFVYTTLSQLQQLERKTARLEGVRSNEEKEQLEAVIESLKRELDESRREHSSLVAETKEGKQKAERARMDMNNLCAEESAAAQVREIDNINANGSETQERSAIDRMGILQVQLDELRLQIARRHRVLFLSSGQMREIVERKTEMMAASKTQHISLSEDRRSLLARVTILRQDVHAAVMDMRRREQRLEHLRNRYNVVRAKSPHGDIIEIKDQEDCVIIIERQRDDLAIERAELSELTDRAESEVASMQKILQDAERSNSDLRASLTHAHDESEASRGEWKKTEALLAKLQVVNDGLARLREREEHLTDALSHLKETLKVAVDEHNALSSDIQEAQCAYDAAMRKYKSQKSKLRRARSNAESAVAAHRAARGFIPGDPATVIELRIRAHRLSETIRKASEIANSSSTLKTVVCDLDAESSLALSPTSSLTSFFTLASSATRSTAPSSIASDSLDSILSLRITACSS